MVSGMQGVWETRAVYPGKSSCSSQRFPRLREPTEAAALGRSRARENVEDQRALRVESTFLRRRLRLCSGSGNDSGRTRLVGKHHASSPASQRPGAGVPATAPFGRKGRAGDSLPSRLAAPFSSFGFIHTRFEKPGDKEPMSPWCLDRSRIVLFTGGEDSILLEPVMGIRSTAFMQIGFHAIGVLSVDESSLRRVGFRYLGLGGREYSLRRCNGALHAPRSRLRTRFPASEGNGYRVSRIYTDSTAQF